MMDIIKKYYLGAWQNIYHISWPVRFLIELIILILAVFVCIKFICYIGKKLKFKNVIVKAWVWIVTEIVYLAGHDSAWAVDANNRMIEWGTKVIDKNEGKNPVVLKRCICIGIVIVYFLAVCVDLPFANYISGYYLEELGNVKSFFRKFEIMVSKGYEKYPPLFVEIAKEESDEDAAVIIEDREPVYIRLNKRGKKGSNIRSEANVANDHNIIGVVDKNSEIVYLDEWTYDGERYWIRVYISEDDLEGWLSGNLIAKDQLKEIINED